MKQKIIKTLPALVILLMLILVIAALAASSYTVLVKDTDSRYFRAKALFIAGDVVFFLKDGTRYDTRAQAIETMDLRYRPAFALMKTISLIEILPDIEVPGPTEGAAVPPMYLGNYRLNAAGNNGYLYLRYQNGAAYGSVRFPGWGKSPFEPLKRLYIAGGRIGFTRSITTRDELERAGTNIPFVQEYSGFYSRDGNIIHGHYRVGGSRKAWEAYKIK
jgi:hypothetical protein